MEMKEIYLMDAYFQSCDGHYTREEDPPSVNAISQSGASLKTAGGASTTYRTSSLIKRSIF